MKTPPNLSRWNLRWREPLSIISTTIYFLVIVILALFSMAAWESWSSYRLLNENVKLSQVASDLLYASDQLAAERGFTVAALNASPSERQVFREELEKYRETGDIQFADAIDRIKEFAASHPRNFTLDLGLLHIEEAKQHIGQLRSRVDSRFNGNMDEIAIEEWFDGISDAIQHARHVRELIMADPFITLSSVSGYKTIRDWIWIISENLGRERALLATYLLTDTPIQDDAAYELKMYHQEVKRRLDMLNDLNAINYIDPRVISSIRDINEALSGQFSDIRDSIYQHSDSANYSVSGEQWLYTATRAIETVLILSRLSSEIIQADIEKEKLTKLLIIFSLLLLSPLIVFLLMKSIQKTREATKFLVAVKQTAEVKSQELSKEVVWRKEIQEKLRLSEQSFLMLIMQNPVGIAVTGDKGTCLFINRAGEKMLNLKMGEIIANKALSLAPLGSRIEIDINYDVHTRGTAEVLISETVWNNKKERLTLLHDITSRKAIENEVAHMTYHDNLTGLANRTLFGSRLEHAINRARRQGSMVAVLFVDIDKFKVINDTLGHTTGDELLGKVAGKLLGCVQDDDTVGRMGGDDFAVLIEDIQSLNRGDAVADKIQDALSGKINIQRHYLNISVSIGISMYPRDTDDPNILIQSADTAMFHAKERGRGTILHFNPEMGERFSERLELESCLHRAVSNREFEIYYQPMVDARSKRITGAEALLRWKHPRLGAVSPETFIPVLEDMRLITDVGKWVLESVCAQNKAWQDSGLSPVVTSVNLSPVQLVLETLEKDLKDVLQSTRLSPEYLELEVTETALMQSPESCAMILHQIMAMGIKIAIDDFGTGYSSLSHLKKLPISKLKIDRSFVMDIPDDKNDMSITQAIISLARNLNLNVIAEGVETAVQLEFLQKNGCDNMQGFYFSQPLTASQFEELLKEQSSGDEFANRRLAML